MAAFGPTTNYVGSNHVDCHGAYACSSMEFIKIQSMAIQSVSCDGSNSCSNTTLIGYNQAYVYCYGYNACLGSNIYYNNNTASLHCAGYRSCADANIYGVSQVFARGSLSLYRAVIDTIGVIASTVTIYLHASYAAYGAHLICRANHMCKIHCKSITACYNLYIDCMAPGGDNCEIISPNIPNSNVPITNLTYFNTISYDLNIFTDFQGAMVEINTDILCPHNGSYDEGYDNSDGADANITLGIDDKGPICCRGSYACSGSYVCWEQFNTTFCEYQTITIEYETQKKTDLMCSGRSACEGSYISNINDTVFCEGYESCYGSMIRYIDYVYCVGVYSCRQSDIIGARYVKCDSYWGCKESTFRSDGVDLFLYFNGFQSGWNAIIYCDKTDICTINCIGYLSCEATQVFCDTDAVNCIINCDIGIVERCPVIFVNGSIWKTTLNPTTINSTSTDTTLISTTSINTTLSSSTSIDTTLIRITSIDTTLTISIQDDKKDDKHLIVIAVMIFLSFLIIMMIVKILRSRKKQKNEAEINNSMLNATNATKDDMMQKNKNALQEKQSHEVDNDENEVQIASTVDELQKEESLRITMESFVGLKEWSHVQVSEWVKTVNNGMFAEYVQSFIDNEINGNVLYDITPEQLQLGLCMNNLVERVEFRNLIQTLKHDKNAMNNNEDKDEKLYGANVEMQTSENTTIGEVNEIELQPAKKRNNNNNLSYKIQETETTKGDEKERALFNEWLTNKVRLPQYYNLLVEKGYKSLDFIKQVTNKEELKAIGIYKKGHLLKLIKEIKELQNFIKEDNGDDTVAIIASEDANVEMQTSENTEIGEVNQIELQPAKKRNSDNNLSHKVPETIAKTIKGDDEKEPELFKEWLTNNVKLPQYYNLLVQNGYESLHFIKQVTDEEELKDIGIYKKGHLNKLIKDIKRLQSFLKENNGDGTIETTNIQTEYI